KIGVSHGSGLLLISPGAAPVRIMRILSCSFSYVDQQLSQPLEYSIATTTVMISVVLQYVTARLPDPDRISICE
nr:hypothetical protein [Alphaproteobacteria bacterium]